VLPGAGSLPQDFTQPVMRYFEFDETRTSAEFLPGITLPLEPFQGILGVQPAGDEAFPSSPPGPYAGNLDLRELVAGTSLFVPVFHPGGRLWTSDSHAVQGDGEVTITAIETAMELAEIQYVLHKNVPLQWPMVETPTHWIGIGTDADLDEAMTICLRNMIGWVSRTADMDPVDAYMLCSLAASFRITQNVNRTKGIHALLPKDLFAPELRQRISITARPGA
jgi:acetamidase/formamidase